MTTEDLSMQLKTKVDFLTAKYDAAKAIRILLDGVREAAEAAGEDPDEAEGEVIDLVNE